MLKNLAQNISRIISSKQSIIHTSFRVFPFFSTSKEAYKIVMETLQSTSPCSNIDSLFNQIQQIEEETPKLTSLQFLIERVSMSRDPPSIFQHPQFKNLVKDHSKIEMRAIQVELALLEARIKNKLSKETQQSENVKDIAEISRLLTRWNLLVYELKDEIQQFHYDMLLNKYYNHFLINYISKLLPENKRAQAFQANCYMNTDYAHKVRPYLQSMLKQYKELKFKENKTDDEKNLFERQTNYILPIVNSLAYSAICNKEGIDFIFSNNGKVQSYNNQQKEILNCIDHAIEAYQLIGTHDIKYFSHYLIELTNVRTVMELSLTPQYLKCIQSGQFNQKEQQNLSDKIKLSQEKLLNKVHEYLTGIKNKEADLEKWAIIAEKVIEVKIQITFGRVNSVEELKDSLENYLKDVLLQAKNENMKKQIETKIRSRLERNAEIRSFFEELKKQ